MDKMKRFFNPGEPQQEESGVMNEISGLSWDTRVKATGICIVIAILLGIGSVIIYFIGNDLVGFALLYTLAVIFGLAATIFLMGPMNQLKRMFDPTRLITTIVFLASLVMTLVSAIVLKISVLVLVFVIIQFLALIWYILSYIPYSRTLITSCCKSTMNI